MFTSSQWKAIQDFVNRVISKRGEPFVQGKVIKVDPVRKVIFMREFGDTAIPIVSFPVKVKYSYKEPSGAVTIKTTTDVEIMMPKVGDTVFVAQQFGTSRLPKCLGVIMSKRYVEASGD